MSRSALAVLIDDGAALEDQIVGFGHCRSAGLEACRQRLRFAASSGKRLDCRDLASDRTSHAGSASSRPRRRQGRRRRRPALSQRARHRRHRQGRRRRGRALPRCSRRRARSSSISSSPRRRPRTAAASSSTARARWRRTLVDKAQLLQAARQGDRRGPVRRCSACWRSGTATARHRIRPVLCRSAPAGARHARDAAAASGGRGRRRSRRRAGRRRGLRGAPHRARRAARRHRFHLWRRLPARGRHGPARRRRFRQGLLRRPGGRLAHASIAAPRAPASCRSPIDGFAPEAGAAGDGGRQADRHASARPRRAAGSRCCGSTASPTRWRPARPLTAGGIADPPGQAGLGDVSRGRASSRASA